MLPIVEHRAVFSDAGVRALAIAVIMQAIKDYTLMRKRRGKKGFKKDGQRIFESAVVNEVKLFFKEDGLGQYYLILAGLDWAPDEILKKIDERIFEL